MRDYRFIKQAISIIWACVFLFGSTLWAQNQSSSENPPELDEAKLKAKILSRIQKADAGKHDAYSHLDPNLVIIEKRIPFQVLNQTVYGIRLKIMPVLPDQKHEFLNLIVDPTLSVQYTDILDMETGASMLNPVMVELRRISLPETNIGTEIYKGNGRHRIVLISDPFCPYCRQVWTYLVEHKNKFKSLRMVDYPIHTTSETVCAVLEFTRQKRLNIFDIINFSYTKLNSSESPVDMLKQYAAKFPLLKKYWGDDLEAAAKKLQEEYLPAVYREQSHIKDLGIVGTPVTFVDGYMIEGGNFPKFDELMP